MLKDLLDRFLASQFVETIVGWAKRIKPPGFEGLSLYDVTRFFWEGIQKGALTTRAAAISFRFFLAAFPVIIMLLSLIPVIPVDNLQENLFASISAFFPGDTFSLFEDTVTELLENLHSDVFSIGFVLSVYYASNSVNAILQGFNGSYNLEQRGNPMVIRLVSIVMMVLLSLFMIIAVSLIIFSGDAFEMLIEYNLLKEDWVFLLQVAKWIITFLLVYGTITILYNIGDFKNRKWKTLSVGATTTTLLFIVTSIGFAWFVNNFDSYNRLYGTLGSFLLLLIWINLNSLILLIGFELNTSINKAKLGVQNTNA